MSETETHPEMRIPKSRYETIFLIAIETIAMLASILSAFNLFNRVAIIASSVWLIFVMLIIWKVCKREGGLRKFLMNRLGELMGTYFVDSAQYGLQPAEIRFGYKLFGHRFIQCTIALDEIESVEWNPGQATGMAGHDMNDWSVCLWFDHNDPAKRKEWSRKPDQDIRIIGPPRRKEDTEAFGLLFVDFLRRAGASLVQGEKSSCFVRRRL